MVIKFTKKWGNYKKGSYLTVTNAYGDKLIAKKVAKEVERALDEDQFEINLQEERINKEITSAIEEDMIDEEVKKLKKK